MNWLAHLHLATVGGVDKAGSLLPDIVNSSNLTLFTPEQQRAIELHQAIDRFTDAHPLFIHSKTFIAPPYTRFAGVLVDIFYDYCLSHAWHHYTQQPLHEFIQETHQALQQQLPVLPLAGQNVLEHLIKQEWLASYQTHEGLSLSLDRISQRLKRRVELAPSVALLKQYEAGFMQDFQAFYPELMYYCERFQP